MSALRPRLGKLRSQMLGLILLILCPLFLLALYGNLQQRESERTRAEERINATAKLTAANEAILFEESRELLGSLSHISFLVLTSNRPYSTLQCIYMRALAPNQTNFGLIEANGKLYCNANRTNSTINLSDRFYFQRVMRERAFAVGNYQPDPLVDEPTLGVGYPVFNGPTQLKRVFFGSLKLAVLGKPLSEMGVAENNASWLLDGAGALLASYPPAANLPDTHFSTQPFVRAALAKRKGTFEAIGPDGVFRLFAAAPISKTYGSNILAVVGVPQMMLYAEADHALWCNLMVMAAVAALALGATWILTRRLILDPVNTMVKTANRLAVGDLSARTGVAATAGELNHLAHAFDGMAENLEIRQKQLETAHHEIQQINSELEGRVRERTIKLETLNKELEAFSYSVSHDLRAPLRHVSGFVELLSRQKAVADDHTSSRYARLILGAAQQMGRLVDDLLAFSRMARTELNLKPVNLEQLTLDVRESMADSLRARKMEWIIGPLPEVLGDLALLRQVLVNLLSNAVKYSRLREHAVIEVGGIAAENEHIIFVRDNGAGFEMKYVHKLFGVFQRLHDSTQFEGTGIGLANVQRIIHRHGGRVWAEGVVGEGATFYFSLPKKGAT